MFEKYTEKARRVIFFARYEASQFGQPYIETEHLMLGILREDKALTNRFLRSHASVESIRRQVQEHTMIRESISTSVDLPLSNDCKRVLANAAEEAEQLGHKHVGTEHLLLGLLREEKCFAAQILHERGLRLLAIREELAKAPQQSAGRGPDPTPIAELFTDLVQAGTDGQLLPVIGRDLEMESTSSKLFPAATRGVRSSSANPAPARPRSCRAWRSALRMQRCRHSWRINGSWRSSLKLSTVGPGTGKNSKSWRNWRIRRQVPPKSYYSLTGYRIYLRIVFQIRCVGRRRNRQTGALV